MYRVYILFWISITLRSESGLYYLYLKDCAALVSRLVDFLDAESIPAQRTKVNWTAEVQVS